jgi:hypothetical protein
VNLLKSPLRRTMAVLASAFIGLAGAVATAAPASATHPTVKGSSECVSDEGWTVEWTLTNKWKNDGTVTAVTVLNPRQGSTLTGDIAVGAEVQQGKDFKLTGTQTLPLTAKFAKIEVVVKFDNGHEEGDAGYVRQPTEKCTQPEPEPEPEPEPGEAKPIVTADCESITIGLDNPENGVDITLTFKTSKGENRELEVKAGEKKTTKFSASEGFSIELGAKGVEGTQKIEYEQPEGCSAGGGGGDDELAVTGAAAGSIAGGAAALLIAGAVMFFVARRRKLRFTA